MERRCGCGCSSLPSLVATVGLVVLSVSLVRSAPPSLLSAAGVRWALGAAGGLALQPLLWYALYMWNNYLITVPLNSPEAWTAAGPRPPHRGAEATDLPINHVDKILYG